jgi:hypothetical protein
MGPTGSSSTAKGVYKFDGSTWSVFNTANSGIADNVVNDIAFDTNGNSWFATRNGVSKFNGSSWISYRTANSGLPNDTTNCIFSEGVNIWIGTKNGLAKFNGTSWSIYNTGNSGLISNYITAINLRSNGELWIGTQGGLSVMAVNGVISSNIYNYIPGNISCIYFENAATAWLGTSTAGLFKIYNHGVTAFSSIAHPTNCSAPTMINSITRGPQGGVLISDGGSVYPPQLPPGFIEIVGSTIFKYPFPTGYGSSFHVFDSNKVWFILRNGVGTSNNICSFEYSMFTGVLTASVLPGLSQLDVNQVKADVLNRGDMHWNTRSAGYEVPKGSGINSIFASSLWIGGVDQGNNLHTAAMTYRQTGNDYWPGPLDTVTGTTDSITSYSYDKIWKLDRWQIDEFRTMFANGSVTAGTYTPAPNIIDWPAHGSGAYTRNMAPFVDVNGDGIYNPLGDGDYPKIKGDQMCYFIFNDNLRPHTETGGAPLQVEIHASAYAYACDSISDSLKVLNYTTFYNYEIYNRGTAGFHNTYVGLWEDADLGGYGDDYVGCSPSGNYTFQMNADTSDESFSGILAYGSNPPMISNVILNGPAAIPGDGIDNDNDGVVDEAGEKNLMTNVLNYNNNNSPVNGNPSNAAEFYSYMHSTWQDGTHLVYGGDGTGAGVPVNFMYDGVPFGTGWSEATLGNSYVDRRILMTCGPFNLNPAQHVNFNFAVVWTRDDKPAYDFQSLYNKNRADINKIRQWYQADAFPSCSPVVAGLNDRVAEENDMALYPNPANDVLNISFSSDKNKAVTIEIYNIQGMLIKELKSNSNPKVTVSIADLSAGLYLLKANDGNSAYVERFVKQ